MNLNTDSLASLDKFKPDMKSLVAEYRRANWDSTRLDRLDDIRYARWEGQTDDGKKHSERRPQDNPAWPFEGASDVRCRMVDASCNELVSLLVTTFSRADLKGMGQEMTDAPIAQVGTTLLRYLRDNRLRQELLREAELGANFAVHYGWTLFFVGWDQRVGRRKQPITMEQVQTIALGAAEETGSNILADMPNLIADKTTEDQASAIIQGLLPGYTLRDTRKLVRALREEGVAEIDEEYVSRNLPMVLALKPYEDVLIPPETVDLQKARVIFRRCWHTEVELREKVITDGWDEAWVDEALKTAGRSTGGENILGINTATSTLVHRTMERANLVEVVYAYTRTMEEGVPVIAYTVFCPSQLSSRSDVPQYGYHSRLDYAHGEYPFVEYRFERTRRAIADSRGVPELSFTDQDEVKAQHDSIRDSTAFETLPPIKVVKRVGQIGKIGPGMQLPVTRQDDYEFMSPPPRPPQTAFSLIERVEAKHANYFGLSHPLVPPVKQQMLSQLRVNNWLSSWTEIFRQMFALCQQYMTPEEIQRITGQPLPQNLTDIAGAFDLHVRFDVRELSDDHVAQKLEAISKFVVPLDAGGIVDRNRLVRLILEAIVPEVAKDLVIDQGQASEAMYRQVQSDIGLMMLGNEPLYKENDPAAKAKMQMVQDVMQKNPKAQQSLQSDQIFQQLFQNYVKNIQMSAMQAENATIGRLGVAPIAGNLSPA